MDTATRSRARLAKAYDQSNWTLVLHRTRLLLAEHPDDAELHFMSGVACMQTGQLEQAMLALGQATALAPGQVTYQAQYAAALAQARKLRQAREIAQQIATESLQDARIASQIGQVFLQANAVKLAEAAFERAVTLAPAHAPYRFWLGYTLNALGDVSGAEHHLESCVDLDAGQWAAHLSLAKLKRHTANTQHIDRLQALLDKHARNTGARIFLNMALAKEHEDLGNYDRAFDHYLAGKSAARSTRPPSSERDRNMFEALMRAFPASIANAHDTGAPAPPIFIVGMPRSGTTLLNRMLANHPDVSAAGELQNFATLLQRASGTSTALLAHADIIAPTRHIDWQRLAADYLESSRPATDPTPRFTDDLPHNFLYAGFIARAFPNVRILCLRRDPLDTCLSNFRHLFQMESGYYDYSLDLLDTGRYLLEFNRLMTHWHRVLPGRILDISYESLVEDTETTIRQALDFCGLSWNEACLHAETNTAPVNTPNAWQVRSPIYTTSIGHWRNYSRHMGDLRKLLADGGLTRND